MKAMIFAAGLGTRLKPLTDNTPKALLPINGKPMLEHVILKLKNAGFHQIAINVHHLGDQIIDFLTANNNFGIEIHISDERDYLLDTTPLHSCKATNHFWCIMSIFCPISICVRFTIIIWKRILWQHYWSANATPPAICYSTKKINYVVGIIMRQEKSNRFIRILIRNNTTSMHSAAFMYCLPKYSIATHPHPSPATSTCPSVQKPISTPMQTKIFI